MKNRKIRCRNCGNYFYPDNYNRHHQKYCSRHECRKASHRASARNYRKKQSENPDFCLHESSRVKSWQSDNPDYKKKSRKNKKISEKNNVLRDFAQVEKLQSDMTVLRDIVNLQYLVIKGVIIALTDDVLRDNIDDFIRQMYDKACKVSGVVPEKVNILQTLNERTDNDHQKVNLSSP